MLRRRSFILVDLISLGSRFPYTTVSRKHIALVTAFRVRRVEDRRTADFLLPLYSLGDNDDGA